MAELCGERHPDRPEVTCDKEKPCYSYCQNAAAGLTWNFRPMPMKSKPDPMAAVEMARRIRRHHGR